MTTPTHLLSVLTPDQRGIIAGLTALLDDADVRLLAISQTVVHDYFTVVMSIAAPADAELSALRSRVQRAVGDDAAVTLMPHRPGPLLDDTGERYVLTAVGPEAPGLVHTVTALVAARGGNFVDFSGHVVGQRLSIVAEVDLPKDIALDQLQIDLRHATGHAGLHVRLQHHRLFVATNEIAFRRVTA